MTKAPFRADEVGSLLRPKELKDARAAHEAGTLDDAGLKAVEDSCIRDAVAHALAAGRNGKILVTPHRDRV